MVAGDVRWRWQELAGLVLVQLTLPAQAWVVCSALFFPHLGIGPFPRRSSGSVAPETGAYANLAWGLWSLTVTPLALMQALVLAPLLCLWLLRTPTTARRRAVVATLLLALVHVALSARIVLATF